jgi:hypothetical protein
MAEYKEDARDGDGDGFLQDGTEFERPVEETTVESEIAEEPETVEEPAPVEEKGDLISSPEPSESESAPALTPVANGVIGSGTAKKKSTAKKSSKGDTSPKEQTVAVYSTRNVTWVGVGRVLTGLNLLPKSEAAQWLTRDHVREAEPSEVSKEL